MRVWSWPAAALTVACLWSSSAVAQTFFYTEVAKDGRIYVFAVPSTYEAFIKGDVAAIGGAIERPGYGPRGETVVFDSHAAINLYNYKHGLPGESFPTPEKPARPKFPSSRISGLMFGDYFWFAQSYRDQVSSSDSTPVRELHGLWFRRLYFTYDFTYSERLTTRFRLEANSNRDLAGSDIVPYVKDAYLQWTYTRKQQLTLGIQPTLTFNWLDEFGGCGTSRRHRRTSIASTRRATSGSRSVGRRQSKATAMPRSSATSRAAAPKLRKARSCVSKAATSRIPASCWRASIVSAGGPKASIARPLKPSRAFATRRPGWVRRTLWQTRQQRQEDLPNQEISVWSAFAVWERPNRADLFVRVDSVKGDLGGVETGSPDAEDIDYWLLSSQSPFTMWIVGGEWYLHPSVRLSPNLELVRYRKEPDPVNFPGRREDAIVRLTFFWTF